MIVRPSEKEVQDYIQSSALNQSKLKLLLVSAQAFQEVKEPELFFEEKEHFLIGKGVDDYITMGKEYFENNYHVGLPTKPSAVIMSIVHQLFATRDSDDWFSISPEIMLSVIDAHNYQPNWKVETKVKKISEEGEQYWNDLVFSEGKTVLSVEQYGKVEYIVQQILTHRFTKYLFEENENTDIYYQLPIYFVEKDIQCKALLDMVVVDHELKEIRPYDIKTIGDYSKNFDYQTKKRRYDIQAAWYQIALSFWANENFPNYEITAFSFIVASTTKQCDSLVFHASADFLNTGQFGYASVYFIEENDELKEYSVEHKGIDQLLQEYKWHEENGWELDYESEMAEGHFIISGQYKRQ